MAEGSRAGVVVARDPAKALVRVEFPDHAGVTSYWLSVAQRNAGQIRDFAMPDIGEHVVCLVDENAEQGYVLGGIYSLAEPPPTQDGDVRMVDFGDGTTVAYNRASHALDVAVNAGGKISLKVGPSSLEIDAAGIRLKGPRIDLN